MALRNFSSVAVATTLTAGITSGATTMTVTALSGYPSAPFLARIDADTVNEELVLVTNVAGTTLTITRGYDSSSAVAHNSGATFAHCASAIDFREANTHVNATAAVHGVTGTIVGTTDTQTLTNKTLTSPTISTILNSGTLTLPTTTDTLVGRATTDTLTNKTLTTPTLTLSTTTSTAEGRIAWDSTNDQLKIGDGAALRTISPDDKAATLTNKTLTSPTINGATLSGTLAGGTFTGSTLTAPTIATITNSGTITLPTGTRTLVARDTTDTLTNKTLTSPVINGAVTGDSASGFGAWVAGSGTVGGAGWALGNGTLDVAYSTMGKTCRVRVVLTLGTTTTAGGSGLTLTLTGPPTPTAAAYGISSVLDTSASNHYSGVCRMATSLVLTPRFYPTALGGPDSVATTSNPITWASTDVLTCVFEYETV